MAPPDTAAGSIIVIVGFVILICAVGCTTSGSGIVTGGLIMIIFQFHAVCRSCLIRRYPDGVAVVVIRFSGNDDDFGHVIIVSPVVSRWAGMQQMVWITTTKGKGIVLILIPVNNACRDATALICCMNLHKLREYWAGGR
jgi:hypothetical protein